MSILNIKEKRKNLGLSQAFFGEIFGVSANTIQNWENGGNIPKTKIHFVKEKLKELENDSLYYNTNKRIKHLIDNVLKISAYEFSKSIGNPRADGIYKILKNKAVPGQKTLNKIFDTYPEYKVWLLTGENAPDSEKSYTLAPDGRLPKNTKGSTQVPFYDVDFAAGNDIEMFESDHIQPAYYMDVPEFSGCSAFRAYSDSMEGVIKSGCVLFATKVLNWNEHLEYGQIYGIVCNDGRRYLKYIRRSENKDTFLLRSENNSYDDFELPVKSIRGIWLIHGWINKRT